MRVGRFHRSFPYRRTGWHHLSQRVTRQTSDDRWVGARLQSSQPRPSGAAALVALPGADMKWGTADGTIDDHADRSGDGIGGWCEVEALSEAGDH